MRAVDPMAVAVDWLDAYRAGRINQIVSMHSPDAVIECACGGRKIIHGFEGITAYWRHRLVQIRRSVSKTCGWTALPSRLPTGFGTALFRRFWTLRAMVRSTVVAAGRWNPGPQFSFLIRTSPKKERLEMRTLVLIATLSTALAASAHAMPVAPMNLMRSANQI